MAGRYLVTGAQIGTLKALAENWVVDDFNKLIDEIEEHQFIGNSMTPVMEDVKEMEGYFDEKTEEKEKDQKELFADKLNSLCEEFHTEFENREEVDKVVKEVLDNWTG